ncbi:MAG: phage terminase large subunit family protein [Acidobacteria bacterium]|nr:phage terminase large subunit family protein [Acidobacteriota bacterium]
MASLQTLRPEALQNLLAAHARARRLLAPHPKLKISEWAEHARVIPKGSTSRPGLWQTESFQREMMDVVLDPRVREMICAKSTQVGVSEILNNICGYFIDADPKPIMIVQPTDQTAKSYSKKHSLRSSRAKAQS